MCIYLNQSANFSWNRTPSAYTGVRPPTLRCLQLPSFSTNIINSMAGMLPGVECARRRRLHHQSRRSSDSHGIPTHNYTRHPAICLYATNLEYSHHSPSLNKDRDSFVLEKYVNENLDATAKEAKERLDKKFQTQTKLHTEGKNKPIMAKMLMAKRNQGLWKPDLLPCIPDL